MRVKILTALALVTIAVASLHLAGIYYDYYWEFWWWSVIVHIFGGVWAGFFCMWFARCFYRRLTLAHVVLGAFLIGAAWEIFEYVFGIGGSPFMSYQLSTAKDLFDDAVGGLLAGVIASLL